MIVDVDARELRVEVVGRRARAPPRRLPPPAPRLHARRPRPLLPARRLRLARGHPDAPLPGDRRLRRDRRLDHPLAARPRARGRHLRPRRAAAAAGDRARARGGRSGSRACAATSTDLNALERALDEHAITHVIHLAALQVPFVRADPPLGARVDVLGTVNVFEAVRRRSGPASPRSSTRPRSPRSATATIRARSTASSSARTSAPPSATSRTTASRRSACARTPSTGRGATRA